MTDRNLCDVRPDSDGHVADALYYVEWDEVWNGERVGLAAMACADCAARLREGDPLNEYMNRPIVVKMQSV